jgi:predicted sulfurtransferase
MGKILLFYKYIDISDPAALVNEQRAFCESLGLKGRILIAKEGINGTIGGTQEATTAYSNALKSHTLFHDIDIKESDGSADYFPRLQVTHKKTIVNFGVDPDKISAKDAGIALSPEEAHSLLQTKPNDLVIFDARNNYESKVGSFTGALHPDIDHFRELPQYFDEHLDLFKNKKVLMFCTGGIRCERATAYLKLKNVAAQVYHIRGGIHRYIEQYPEGFFRGKNYVFDGRVSQQITADVLAQCEECKQPYDEYSNCINAECNKQIIVCPECVTVHHNTCSPYCMKLVDEAKVNIRTLPHKIMLEQKR